MNCSQTTGERLASSVASHGRRGGAPGADGGNTGLGGNSVVGGNSAVGGGGNSGGGRGGRGQQGGSTGGGGQLLRTAHHTISISLQNSLR